MFLKLVFDFCTLKAFLCVFLALIWVLDFLVLVCSGCLCCACLDVLALYTCRAKPFQDGLPKGPMPKRVYLRRLG